MDAFENAVTKVLVPVSKGPSPVEAWRKHFGEILPSGIMDAVLKDTGLDKSSTRYTFEIKGGDNIYLTIYSDPFDVFCLFEENRLHIDYIEASLNHKGIGKLVMYNLTCLAKDLGKEDVTLTATKKGRYVWPRMGFQQLDSDEAVSTQAQERWPELQRLFNLANNAPLTAYVHTLLEKYLHHPRLPEKIAGIAVHDPSSGREIPVGRMLLEKEPGTWGMLDETDPKLRFPLNGAGTVRALQRMRHYVEQSTGKKLT